MGRATLFCGWSSTVRVADPFPDREAMATIYAGAVLAEYARTHCELTGAVLNTRGSHWSGAEYATGNWSEEQGARRDLQGLSR